MFWRILLPLIGFRIFWTWKNGLHSVLCGMQKIPRWWISYILCGAHGSWGAGRYDRSVSVCFRILQAIVRKYAIIWSAFRRSSVILSWHMKYFTVFYCVRMNDIPYTNYSTMTRRQICYSDVIAHCWACLTGGMKVKSKRIMQYSVLTSYIY